MKTSKELRAIDNDTRLSIIDTISSLIKQSGNVSIQLRNPVLYQYVDDQFSEEIVDIHTNATVGIHYMNDEVNVITMYDMPTDILFYILEQVELEQYD